MENFRFKALSIAIDRKPVRVEFPEKKTSEYFGENTFNKMTMRKYLSDDTYRKVMDAIDKGEKIDRKITDQVANSLKVWAISKGATHYTHWFQPLTGLTAEKHDAFLGFIKEDYPIETFQGTELTQQEPDASSFPSGGIRNTFEARGYTAWDPTSPAFIIDRTLCIPTVFISYTGEALDFKTPLLKALNLVEEASVEVCQLFDKKINKVFVTLGWEQEYFLVDSALYNARPDMLLSGRTLFGHASAKDQQLEDNYFGTIPERAIAFMQDLEIESHKLGIPVKTRHNEVAPNQFECAPIFEEANIAVDHNQLIMDLIEKIAKRHNFVALLHEKPYAGVNGSGKHNNWSLMTDNGENLLSPGKTSKSNFRFLTFLVNTIMAVYKYNELVRASITSAGNDHRLGANEAPPAIMSVFIGKHLTKILDEIETKEKKGRLTNNNGGIHLSISKIPEILIDNTDRNRTSPFAFTGNKFEFRAVGSAANCSSAMISLNTIVAQQLMDFKKEVQNLTTKGNKKNDAIYSVLKKYIKASKPIRFEGNNYSGDWVKEAEKRGLKNIQSTPEALKAYISKETIDLFERNKILSSRELEARYEVLQENYVKKIQIEARILGDLAINHIIPVAISYQNKLLKNVKGLKEVMDQKTFNELTKSQIISIKDISYHILNIRSNVNEMIEARKKANIIEDNTKKAIAYNTEVFPYLEKIRNHIDKLELLVDDEIWPMPKYRELLFIK